jgi:hypothetical protein
MHPALRGAVVGIWFCFEFVSVVIGYKVSPSYRFKFTGIVERVQLLCNYLINPLHFVFTGMDCFGWGELVYVC